MPLSITKPTVGGSSGTWGTENNTALDAIKAFVDNLEKKGRSWSSFPSAASWMDPFRIENAQAQPGSGALNLTRLTVPVGLKLSGISVRWGTGTAGDLPFAAIYNDTGYGAPGTRFHSVAGAALGATDQWSSVSFAEMDWPEGDYWVGPMYTGAASRNLFYVNQTYQMLNWGLNPHGTGADPAANIGNAGLVANQTGLTGPPATFAGTLPGDSNGGKVPYNIYFKVRKV